MKRIMFCTSLVMLMQGNTFAEKSEVFPFSDIAVGMSSKELLEKHPTEEILASKKTGDQILERGVVMYNIPENKFWDSLGVHVSNAKVQSLTYCNVNKKLLLARDTDAFDFSSVVKNVSPLFKELKQQLGSTFEKKVTSRSVRETKIRGPMYVWKREKDFALGNSNNIISPLDGFALQGDRIATELAQISAIYDAAEKMLTVGLAGPHEAAINKLLSDLNNAGMQKVKAELQRQIDEFLANKNGEIK